jgi:hypothetical protein
MKKTIFILDDEKPFFTEVEKDIYPFLSVVTCKQTNGQTITLFENSEDEPLCLHNDEFCSQEDETIAVNLFLNHDVTFLEHLDFFTSKNPRIQNPLINSLKNL